MKRIFSFIMIAIVACLLVTGCGKKEANEKITPPESSNIAQNEEPIIESTEVESTDVENPTSDTMDLSGEAEFIQELCGADNQDSLQKYGMTISECVTYGNEADAHCRAQDDITDEAMIGLCASFKAIELMSEEYPEVVDDLKAQFED